MQYPSSANERIKEAWWSRVKEDEMAYKPIRDYGLISDMRTAALVSLDGAIDWMCWPKFDSPAIFCALLDDKKGGHFSITPVGAFQSTQKYITDSNVLVTVFENERGQVELIDFLSIADDKQSLYRVIKGLSGEMEIKIDFRPRFNYGRDLPIFDKNEASIKVTSANEELELYSQIPLQIEEDARVGGVYTIKAGDQKTLTLGRSGSIETSAPDVDTVLDQTVEFWRKWLVTCPYKGPWGEWVSRSALVVRALTYKPTGLIVAAPTTSLPEEIGSNKNWDYRYVWLRDASMVLAAMFHLGHMTDEGQRFLKFLADKCAGGPANLKIMYDISGNLLDGEKIIPELEGYCGSYPVRVGNEASNQVQLDVFGEVLLTARRYVEVVGELSPELWDSMVAIADFIVDNWRRPDSGIWEERGKPRHYTHSKMMCAVGLRSILAIQEKTAYSAPIEKWSKAHKEIRETILHRAWNEKLNSFTKVFDSDELDASLILMSVYDFLPATDERLRSTVDLLIHTLGRRGLMYRFKWEGEEIGASEGAVAIASIWLAIHFIKLGKLDFAAEYIQALIDSANHVGLFAEEFDPKTGDFLGNFPQLFVHTALIDAIHDFRAAKQAQEKP